MTGPQRTQKPAPTARGPYTVTSAPLPPNHNFFSPSFDNAERDDTCPMDSEDTEPTTPCPQPRTLPAHSTQGQSAQSSPTLSDTDIVLDDAPDTLPGVHASMHAPTRLRSMPDPSLSSPLRDLTPSPPP